MTIVKPKLLLLSLAVLLVPLITAQVYVQSSKKPVFAILTDFGLDFAVASMKGLLLSSLPEASIIDFDHSLNKFSVLSASFILEKTYHYFPMRHYFSLCR